MNQDVDQPIITIEPMAPPPPPSKATVEIIADVDGFGNLKWRHDNGPAHGGNGKLKLKQGENHEVTFKLVDNTKLEIRFDASQPIFVKEGSGGSCPRAKDSDLIMVSSCSAKELVIIDWNYGIPCELQYQLNFVNNIGGPIPAYDPIIENGGGGTKPTLTISNQ